MQKLENSMRFYGTTKDYNQSCDVDDKQEDVKLTIRDFRKIYSSYVYNSKKIEVDINSVF